MVSLKLTGLTCLMPLFLLLWAGAITAQTDDRPEEASPATGHVDFPVSCSPAAQQRFENAVVMLHHMMYAQSEREFRSLAASEPDCAMAYWGIAMALFHPLWPGEPGPEELQQGSAAIAMAASLSPVTAREQAYIDAAGAYYRDWDTTTHGERIAAWEATQRQAFSQNSNDVDAAALFALALLATAPKADKSYSHQKRAGALLEELYAKAPGHPGVVHYLIHAYDNPELASRAVAAARAYDRIAPEVPHALHMPTHIFTRLGIWADSIDWNVRSARAALNYPVDGTISHHYLHALDYLIYAYLQGAEDIKAGEVLQQMQAHDNYQQTFVTGYALAALPARYTLERRQWKDAATLQLPARDSFPWEDYPEVEAIIRYASGLGAARSGDTAGAQREIARLDAIHARLADAGQQYWGVIVDAQRKTVTAWLDFAHGRKDAALDGMREAANLEDSVDKNPVTPGSVLPAWELLGEMLLLSENPEAALAAYETSLATAPNRFNSLYGAGSAAEQLGDTELAVSYYATLMRISARADGSRPEIQRAAAYLNRAAVQGQG